MTLFMGAMIATSGTTWALQHDQPVPWVVWLAPVAALALTSLLLGLARAARQRMGVPLGPGALRRQRRVLLAAFLIGGLAGVWAANQAPSPAAVNSGQTAPSQQTPD